MKLFDANSKYHCGVGSSLFFAEKLIRDGRENVLNLTLTFELLSCC